ncbi:MAG TPA: chromate efflux transporter [Steroidobacteraceae bacterium]
MTDVATQSIVPSFGEAARFWIRLGFISFGGPAGQIAILHREVVEQRGWLDERRFTDALNFCMLLPGPEALQLAIYLGWKLHGVRGGLVAGLGFIVPSIALLLGLSWIYARYGSVPALHGVLLGLKAAVIALVLQAIVRIGRRALGTPVHFALAVFAFIALQFGDVPFPLVLLVAATAGIALRWRDRVPPHVPAAVAPGHWRRTLAVGLALWVAPLIALAPTLGLDSLWGRLYLFFSKAALVTFGGAYAVLGYVTQHLVHDLGWLTAEQAVAGLALAETTPGPLVIVLQFMGFMTGWNQSAPLSPEWSATLAALLAAWATFLPSFVLIFLGAPYIERLAHAPRFSGALAAITAAVVGVIVTLLVLLARAVFLTAGTTTNVQWPAVLIAAICAVLLTRTRLALHWVLSAAALAGLVCSP